MSKGWTRFTSSCTSGSKSWTPIETRLKPRFRRTARCSGVVTRGSTSTETSASVAGRNVSRRCCARRSACAGVRYVGVPPPQCTCSICAARGRCCVARRSISRWRSARYPSISSRVVALPVGLRDDLHEAAAEPALLVAEGEVDVERDRATPPRSPARRRPRSRPAGPSRSTPARSGRTCSGAPGRCTCPAAPSSSGASRRAGGSGWRSRREVSTGAQVRAVRCTDGPIGGSGRARPRRRRRRSRAASAAGCRGRG